jgi:hypothetical protein
MDELYRLYGDDETDDVTKTITTITDDDQRRFDSIAAFVPFARAAPIQKITDGDSSSSTGLFGCVLAELCTQLLLIVSS